MTDYVVVSLSVLCLSLRRILNPKYCYLWLTLDIWTLKSFSITFIKPKYALQWIFHQVKPFRVKITFLLMNLSLWSMIYYWKLYHTYPPYYPIISMSRRTKWLFWKESLKTSSIWLTFSRRLIRFVGNTATYNGHFNR